MVAVGGVLEVDVEVVGCRMARHMDWGFALRHGLHIVCLLGQSFAGLRNLLLNLQEIASLRGVVHIIGDVV